jgi:hypothetical protein
MRYTRVCILLVLLTALHFKIPSKILPLQLLIEREKLQIEIFKLRLIYKNQDYYRLPTELTQEHLPLCFQYYNCLIPLLHNVSTECFNIFLLECDRQNQAEWLQSGRKPKDAGGKKSLLSS